MIPDSGANLMGTIIHSVLEWAYREGNRGSSRAIDVWDQSVEEMNDELANQPINAHLAPLQDMNNYLKRRGKICHRSERIIRGHTNSENGGPRYREGDGDSRLAGPEVIVQDDIDNPRVKGKVDLISDDGTSIELFDWKTGRLMDENDSIKSEYVVQVQLYAALIERTQIARDMTPVRFPSRATLINPETGESATVEQERLNPMVCRNTLDDAIEMHREINASVAKDASTQNLLESHAKPDIIGCRYCTVRPACVKYLANLDSWMKGVSYDDEDLYVQDVIGQFVVLKESGPRSSIGTIIIEDSQARPWRIAGIDIRADRNESVINSITEGDRIIILNTRNNNECNLLDFINIKAHPWTHILYILES